MRSQSMSNALWALEKLRFSSHYHSWAQPFFEHSLPLLPTFNGQSFSSVLAALVRLSVRPPHSWLMALCKVGAGTGPRGL